MEYIIIALSTFFVSLVLSRILITIAPKDAPDALRKTQNVAVATSGGIAIAASGAIGCLIYLSLYTFENNSRLAPHSISGLEIIAESKITISALISLLVLGLGALDDRFTLPAKVKFAAMAALALAVCVFGQFVSGIFLPVFDSYVILASWIGILGSALWLFVMMNATNFMDGSNGLAMGTLVIMLIGISLRPFYALIRLPVWPSEVYGQFLISGLTGLIIAAILGFLFWNLQGKLYAGDAGSLFGGAVFASLGLYAAQDGNIWFPATLALPFLVDVFMTLLWRARRGHNLLTPHRHHAYQLFIRSGWTHIKTALLWWALATICAIAALWAASESKSMSAWVFFGLLGAGCALWIAQRRHFRTLAENG